MRNAAAAATDDNNEENIKFMTLPYIKQWFMTWLMPLCFDVRTFAHTYIFQYSNIWRHKFAKNQSNCRYTLNGIIHTFYGKRQSLNWKLIARSNKASRFPRNYRFELSERRQKNRLYWTVVAAVAAAVKQWIFYYLVCTIQSIVDTISFTHSVTHSPRFPLKWQRQKLKRIPFKVRFE